MHSTTYQPATVTDAPTPYRTKTGKPHGNTNSPNLKRGHLITKENAAAMGRKGGLVAKQRHDERIAQIFETQPNDDFKEESLSRLRKLIATLDKRIATVADPAGLERLATARGKLADQEAELAGRPRSTARTKGQPTAAPLIQGD